MQHRVLLVEDSEDVRELLTLVLESAGFTVTSVADAETAINIFHDTSIDIVLTDYQLPGVNGDVLVRHIHQQTMNTPVILMSAYRTLPGIAVACGANAYFIKAGSTARLITLLMTIIDQR